MLLVDIVEPHWNMSRMLVQLPNLIWLKQLIDDPQRATFLTLKELPKSA
jgi:hypothetical protein